MQKIVTTTRLRKKSNTLRLLPAQWHKACMACMVSAFMLVSGCSNIECPLDNIVVMTCGLYSAESHEPLKLQATLDIKPAGKDTILLNRASDIKDFLLPLRQAAPADTFLLHFSDNAGRIGTDTLFVEHVNMPHYESIECPATVFHTLTRVRWNRQTSSQFPLTIDSVALVRTAVNYDDIENIRIYLRTVAP